MKTKIVIVDNFLEDPNTTRKLALRVPFDRNAGATYPGANSTEQYWTQEVMEKIAGIVKFDAKIKWDHRSATGNFRSSPESSEFKQDIHVDLVEWSGVLYLNTNEQCEGKPGTTLWRHKKYGWEEYPTVEQMKAVGLQDSQDPEKPWSDQVFKEIIYKDGLNRELWEPLISVPMRFNRLILFRSNQWHSHAENFGKTLEDSRLIQVFFFEEGEK